MKYITITGERAGESVMREIIELKNQVYKKPSDNNIDDDLARWRANKNCFVAIRDKDKNILVGYIVYFPCTQELYEDILYHTDVIRDGDIRPEEIAPYSTESNHLFVISIAILEEYRETDAIRVLSDTWIRQLNRMQTKGYPITDISAITISKDGEKAMHNYRFNVHRRLKDGNTVYLCEGAFLKRLLKHNLYFKSYRHDAYLVIPVKGELHTDHLDAYTDVPSDVRAYFHAWRDRLHTHVPRGLPPATNTYLGDLSLIYTAEGRELGTETAHAFLTWYEDAGTGTVTLVIPDSAYSASRLSSLASENLLEVRQETKSLPNPAATVNEFLAHTYDSMREAKKETNMSLRSYLRKSFGVTPCGDAKCVFLLGGCPSDEYEIEDTLDGKPYDTADHRKPYDPNEVLHFDDSETACGRTGGICYDPDKFSQPFMERVTKAMDEITTVSMATLAVSVHARMDRKTAQLAAHPEQAFLDALTRLHDQYVRLSVFTRANPFACDDLNDTYEYYCRLFGTYEHKQRHEEAFRLLEHSQALHTAKNRQVNGVCLNIVIVLLAAGFAEWILIRILQGFFKTEATGFLQPLPVFTVYLIACTLVITIGYAVALTRKPKPKKKKDNKHEKPES